MRWSPQLGSALGMDPAWDYLSFCPSPASPPLKKTKTKKQKNLTLNQGCLAGLVGETHNSWPRGCKFLPYIRYWVYLKIKFKLKKKLTLIKILRCLIHLSPFVLYLAKESGFLFFPSILLFSSDIVSFHTHTHLCIHLFFKKKHFLT